MGITNPIHIGFVLIILLLVFGAKRLPEMGRSLGAGMRGFRDSLTDGADSAVPLDHTTALRPVPPLEAAVDGAAALSPTVVYPAAEPTHQHAA
jgi:sec-independent protein translocase protein TatA